MPVGSNRTAWIAFGLGAAAGLLGLPGVMIGLDLAEGNSSEWMSFAGSLLGSAVTVAGAFLLVQWQQHSADTRQTELMVAQLKAISAWATHLMHPHADDGRNLTRAERRHAVLSVLRQRMRSCKEARQWAIPKDALTLDAYSIIERLDMDLDLLPNVINKADTEPERDMVLAMKCDWIKDACALAIEYLRGNPSATLPVRSNVDAVPAVEVPEKPLP